MNSRAFEFIRKDTSRERLITCVIVGRKTAEQNNFRMGQRCKNVEQLKLYIKVEFCPRRMWPTILK
jgi:hypothetical protein